MGRFGLRQCAYLGADGHTSPTSALKIYLRPPCQKPSVEPWAGWGSAVRPILSVLVFPWIGLVLMASWQGSSKCMACSNPMCSIPPINFLTSTAKLLHCLHRLRTCWWSMDRFRVWLVLASLAISVKMSEKILRGSRTHIGLFLVVWRFMFVLNFISFYNSWLFTMLSFKALSTLV